MAEQPNNNVITNQPTVQEQIDKTADQAQFGVVPVPFHIHNGVDSPYVDIKNIARFPSTPSQGDVVYYNGNTWTKLVAGTSGQFLKTLGSGANPSWAFAGKFGGDGSDGALSVSSGTTTISLGAAKVVIKNYTSISITGTGAVAFSNPHAGGTVIVLKSQGNVTLTSSSTCIDASGMGSAGGASGGRNSDGGLATAPNLYFIGTSSLGTIGKAGSGGNGGVASTQGATFSVADFYGDPTLKNLFMVPGLGGSGGGGGADATNAAGVGGAGGNGGGALIIECGGVWNFTTANGISVAGSKGVVGGVGSDGTNGAGGGGGGGGGTGGMFVGLYNSLTANTGSVNVNSGNGGNGGNGGSTATNPHNNAGSGGGSGGSGSGSKSGQGGGGGNGGARTSTLAATGGTGGAMVSSGNGNVGTDGIGGGAGFLDSGGGGGGGGSGGAGYSTIVKNTFFA